MERIPVTDPVRFFVDGRWVDYEDHRTVWIAKGTLIENASGTATQADDRIIYNMTTGNLYYDADGAGAGNAIHLAWLAGAPALEADDIVVIA